MRIKLYKLIEKRYQKLKKSLIHFKYYMFGIYAILQVLFLAFLRKQYLLTVYQTAITYFLICLVGILLIFIADKKKSWWKIIQNSYLVAWSSFHGIVVLGFLSSGTFYLTLTQINIIQVVNIFLGFAIYWILYVIVGKCVTAIGIGNLIIGVMGVLNRYLVRFRGATFRISDITAAKTAGNVVQNYNFLPDTLMVVAIADLILWYILIRYWHERQEARNRFNILNFIVTVIVTGGCIALPLTHFEETYEQTGNFAADNYLADLLVDIQGNAATVPDDYSLEEVLGIITAWQQEQQGINMSEQSLMGQEPNIVIIMNEAFSDLRVLGEFATDIPVLEYWDSIQEETVRGWANVSVLGGTTANSEYELLSSDTTGVFSGNNRIPYNKYFSSNEVYPGLVSILRDQGYETIAFHPYYASGWNRTQVYRAMQFEHIIFMEDLDEEMGKLRIYTSDEADYSYIRNWFDNKEVGVPQFFFNVTMQNHGGYTYSGDNFKTTVHLAGEASGKYPQAEQFLSLMKASDEALEGLLSYFLEYPEPVIVLLFGDHQPNLETDFYEYVTGEDMNSWSLEQRMNQYKTPFIIWSNAGIDAKELGDVSLNYLAPILLEYAGLEMSEFQRYTLEQFDRLPMINRVGLIDSEGNAFEKKSEEFQALTREFRMLVYNHTVDAEGRVDAFFMLE